MWQLMKNIFYTLTGSDRFQMLNFKLIKNWIETDCIQLGHAMPRLVFYICVCSPWQEIHLIYFTSGANLNSVVRNDIKMQLFLLFLLMLLLNVQHIIKTSPFIVYWKQESVFLCIISLFFQSFDSSWLIFGSSSFSGFGLFAAQRLQKHLMEDNARKPAANAINTLKDFSTIYFFH